MKIMLNGIPSERIGPPSDRERNFHWSPVYPITTRATGQVPVTRPSKQEVLKVPFRSKHSCRRPVQKLPAQQRKLL